MAGALIEIVAVGVQDVYLIGNAQITYWKVVYRRHTNFAVESSEQTLNNGRFGAQANCTVVRNGDLAAGCALKLEMKALAKSDCTGTTKVAYVRRLGHAMTSEVKVDIGGTTIDTHVSVWLDLWYELTHTDEQERGYRNLIGDVDALTKPVVVADVADGGNALPAYTLYVPLQFWFNRNTGLALPLIALQYHEVRFYVTFAAASSLLVYNGTAPTTSNMGFTNASVLVDYVFLDSDERRKFAQVGHEYLIEQVQSNSGGDTVTTGPNKFTLNFNHPCKELVWAVKVGAFSGANGTTDKFVTYAHDGDWKSAIDTYAKGLVESFVTITGDGEADPANATAVTGTAELTGTTDEMIGNIHMHVVQTGENDASELQGIQDDTVWLYTGSAQSLADKIDYAYVHVVYNELGGASADDSDGSEAYDATLTSLRCTEISHRITIEDISVPIADGFVATGRNTANKANCPNWDDDWVAPMTSNYGLNLDGSGNPVTNSKLLLNNHARFSSDGQDGNYFNFYQTRCHTRTPADGVNVFSFALHPENHQPSGSANLSRIDSVVLQLTMSAAAGNASLTFATGTLVYIFAVNYNVLRIMSGMGGLAYSN